MISAATQTGGIALAARPLAQSAGSTGHPQLAVLGAVALALLLTVLLTAGDGDVTRSALAAARRENGALRVRQESLRKQILELSGRLDALRAARNRGTAASILLPGAVAPPIQH